MTKKPTTDKKYSEAELEKIRGRAREIWKRKCQALNTALDDWLQAEQELRATTKIRDKSPDQYTAEEITTIKERAQAIREEKVQSLRTAFDDWIEAEQELKEELKKKIDLHDFFGLWFNRSSSRVTEMLEKDEAVQRSMFDDVLERQYVELMAECMR